MFLLFMFMLFTFGMFLLQAAGVSAAQGIALTFAGIIAPIIAQVIKNWTNAGGVWAMLLAALVAGVIAIVASFIVGDWHTFGDLVKNAVAVFGVATIVFHIFIAPRQSATS